MMGSALLVYLVEASMETITLLMDSSLTWLKKKAALFFQSSGTVENIAVTNADITTTHGFPRAVGVLVGENNGIVSNARATGQVRGAFADTGGLVGLSEGPISNSSASVTVRGDGERGGLVGKTFAPVSNSSASGNVKATDSSANEAGGLIGDAQSGTTVSNSSASGDVNGTSLVGGLVGVTEGPISNSSASGDVNATGDGSGGLVGYNGDEVSDSNASGNVSGNNNVGGLIGDSAPRELVSNSFATGAVSGNKKVGGLVGRNIHSVSNSYATGDVSGNDDVGGLVGVNDRIGTVSESYWDTEATNQSTSADGTGLTTSQMQGDSATSNMDAFDFDNVWKTVEGDYPELRE
jgi:hypothetical protein